MSFTETARFRLREETRPPESPNPTTAPPIPAAPRPKVPPREAASPAPQRTEPPVPRRPPGEVFRFLENNLMEIDFSGKVYLKQGTIYSYSGNLTFWVKEKRSGGQPALVIVTGTGRIILTDKDREITFMQVTDETVHVEPGHLLACEEGLSPRYVALGEEDRRLEFLVLEGRGMVALCAASKPLPLAVTPGLPVSVPASSIIMWSGQVEPEAVVDPQIYEIMLPAGTPTGSLIRLVGSGRVLVEQSISGQG